MKVDETLARYALLIEKADQAFVKIADDYSDCVTCKIRCSDCCHAVFGLFLIEAVHVRRQFCMLGEAEQAEVLKRAEEADQAIEAMQQRLEQEASKPGASNFALAKERIRCPLLTMEDECMLYEHRPLTCRVYGIPTAIQGRGHVCELGAFKDGEPYPTFDLDNAYKAMHLLSRELLENAGYEDLERASLMFSLSKALQTPEQELLDGGLILKGDAVQ